MPHTDSLSGPSWQDGGCTTGLGKAQQEEAAQCVRHREEGGHVSSECWPSMCCRPNPPLPLLNFLLCGHGCSPILGVRVCVCARALPQCKRCKSTDTDFYQKQTRSADEPMTTWVPGCRQGAPMRVLPPPPESLSSCRAPVLRVLQGCCISPRVGHLGKLLCFAVAPCEQVRHLHEVRLRVAVWLNGWSRVMHVRSAYNQHMSASIMYLLSTT